MTFKTKVALYLFSIFAINNSSGQGTLPVRTPCKQYPNITDNFTASKPNYHYYFVENVICNTDEFKNATKSKVYSFLLTRNSYIAPTFNTNPVTSCTKINANIGVLIAGKYEDDPILTVLDKNTYSASNFTLEGHDLHAGKVVREIIQRGKIISIRTRGTGNNKNKVLGWINNWQMPMEQLWGAVDKVFIEDVRKFLKENDKPQDENKVPQDDEVSLSEGAKLLFKGVKTKLTANEKNAIYTKLGFNVSKDRKEFTVKGGEDYAFTAVVLPTDMNKDGNEEIFVAYGNNYTSGMTGSEIILFIKGNATYEANLGFPGLVPEALTTSNQGYYDLLIGGPGFEFPIWRWNGYKYVLHRRIKNKDVGATKSTNIETISKAYQKSFK